MSLSVQGSPGLTQHLALPTPLQRTYRSPWWRGLLLGMEAESRSNRHKVKGKGQTKGPRHHPRGTNKTCTTDVCH